MRPIKWRKERGTVYRVATVEGVRLRSCDDGGYFDLRTVDPRKDEHVYLELPGEMNRREHLDAAAYALADLVATLRGME